MADTRSATSVPAADARVRLHSRSTTGPGASGHSPPRPLWRRNSAFPIFDLSPLHTRMEANEGPARRPPQSVAKARPRGQEWMSVSTIPPAAVDEGRRARLHVALGGFTLLVVAGAQALLDPALPIDLLYVLPVAVIALAGGRPMGVAAGVLAAVLRSVVETWSGVAYVHPAM